MTVASIGNASSLRGGELLMTPLRGADGQVYALAQGSVVVSGFGVNGKDGSRISLNVPSSGRIPNGATVEREVPSSFATDPYLVLNLNTPDFTTAARVADAHQQDCSAPARAEALDAVSIKVARADRSQPAHRLSSRRSRPSRSSRARRPRASSSIRAPAPSSSARTCR